MSKSRNSNRTRTPKVATVAVPHKAAAPTDPMAETPTPKKQTRDSARGGSILTIDKGRPRIRYQIPSVARYCARVILKHAMDFELAVESIGRGQMDIDTIREIARNMQDSPEIQAAIEAELTIHGLDDKSKEAFVHELWDWLRSENDVRAVKAAGVLGRGFIAERINVDKPEQLPIEGMEDAVKSMLGTSAQSNKPEPSQNEPETELPN